MNDPRIRKLAELLINHSTRLQKGEHVLIEGFDVPDSIVIELIRAARKAGGHPHVAERTNRIMRALNEAAGDDNLAVWAEYDKHRMSKMHAYIGVRGSENVSEMAGIPDEQMKKAARLYGKPVHFEQRINHTKWCVLRWPTPSMAQLAQMSTEAFENFYFDVCTLDYARMDRQAQSLVKRMQKTNRVQLKGPGETDLKFSIKGIPIVPCCGDRNIPDGEVFTSPVRDSVDGIIHFNTPTIYNGLTFENVRLEFRQGKIVEASADQNSEQLNSIFDTDEGARYVGEFAIGFNPYILQPMKDILFDEKVAGSLHFTPGRAYEEADNGNRSEIHWDLVLIQREDYGGGTIVFDDEVVRRDGMFVPRELQGLNPEALKK
ncbi:MAG: aminopeptidase [Phycisphaerales bacterium]|nr:aminopeptidase [Phycisphaerales bacterium]MCI0629606.1 aminopeptidase [Phycisphaerales bacterium]